MAAFPRTTAFAVALLVFATACGSDGEQAAAPPATQPGPADAVHDVRLRASGAESRWRGSQSIAFTNAADAPLSRIWLRLWANGVDGCAGHAVRVHNPQGATLGPMRRACTAVALDLPDPLPPGERTEVTVGLDIHVPDRNDRFGRHRHVALLGGALPVLAVLDETGWHLDPYVDIGEAFYSLTSSYRLRLDVPRDTVTAATGVRIRERLTPRRAIRTYRADGVRDVAIAAGALHHLRGEDDHGTTIHVWYEPSTVSASRARRVRTNAERSLSALSDAFGAYPYTEVDIVTSAFTTFGGMEYPQIVFSNQDRLTVAHELAHQWWWGIVGNDEYASPWLDESLAMWSMYYPFEPWVGCDGVEWPSPQDRITNGMDYFAPRLDNYWVTVYSGGGCMFAALADEIGTPALVEALRGYAEDHWLGVTTSEALKTALEDAAAVAAPGLDMDAFWQEWRVD